MIQTPISDRPLADQTGNLTPKFARGLASFALLAGAVTLAGWWTDSPRLTDWWGTGTSMFSNAAMAAACAGSALLIQSWLAVPRWAVAALALFVTAIGAATLLEHFFGLNLGIDTILSPGTWGNRAAMAPGRMGPPASISFTLIGLALDFIALGKRGSKCVPAFGIVVCAISLMNLAGYAFGANPLFSIARFTGVALQTAWIIMALGLALIMANPELEPFRMLKQRTSAGQLARRGLLAVIGLPLLLGWLCCYGEKAGWADAGTATAILVLLLIAAFSVILWRATRSIAASETSLRENETRLARLAAIVESSDDAIITKDLNGVIVSWNAGAERVFGYQAKEAVGNPVSMLIPPHLQNEEPNILARIRRGERIDHYETVRRRKDGALLNISLTVSPLKNEAGQIIGASKIARDITQLKEAHRALATSHEELEKRVAARTLSLEQAVSQIEEFSYSVSHDLRAPVRAMKGYAQTALEDHGDSLDANVKEYLERILAGSSRMGHLIQDLLDYSKLTRADIQPRPVSLEKLVPEVIETFPEMQKPNSDITIEHPLAAVLAHEVWLNQAISNLLANSVKFVARGTIPRIKIRTESHDGRVRLWVQDNGIGIDPKYQARLFGMFERLHQDLSYEGTGIGLAIVRKAAEKMGGRVGVESDGTHGSSFWIELPAAISE